MTKNPLTLVALSVKDVSEGVPQIVRLGGVLILRLLILVLLVLVLLVLLVLLLLLFHEFLLVVVHSSYTLRAYLLTYTRDPSSFR